MERAPVNGVSVALGLLVAVGCVATVYLCLEPVATETGSEIGSGTDTGAEDAADIDGGYGGADGDEGAGGTGDGRAVWAVGQCGLYCGRDDVRVTAFRTVPMPWGPMELYSCVRCLQQLNRLQRQRTRELTAAFRTPLGAGLPSSSAPETPPRDGVPAAADAPARPGTRGEWHGSNSPLWCPLRCRGGGP
ncbi:hypothetical protein E0L36_01480 [Streptomyces sp. AJS327]|uniref:hypothetical protein n=1 Tax=Streptomyces sp. AJS327 TaxID=2545265 RepID=UPI0015DE80DB|nr:hypothetical protein [Streptomyces sp. AJS327]MBA0049624.1 hypothetical protein [Streptomyces sp. AJS327]